MFSFSFREGGGLKSDDGSQRFEVGDWKLEVEVSALNKNLWDEFLFSFSKTFGNKKTGSQMYKSNFRLLFISFYRNFSIFDLSVIALLLAVTEAAFSADSSS